MAKEKTFATWRGNINYGSGRKASAFCLVGDPDDIFRVERSYVPAEKIPAYAIRMDDDYANPDARHKIFAWLTEDGTMHYWTDADTIRLTDMSHLLFSDLRNVTDIDTPGMTDIGEMFYGCSNLVSLDLSSLDTSKVTNMSSMFFGCQNLRNLDL